MKTVVSEKGQVTIPKKLRRQLNLSAGSVLEFREHEGKLIGERRIERSPFEDWIGKGKLPHGTTATGYLDELRDR